MYQLPKITVYLYLPWTLDGSWSWRKTDTFTIVYKLQDLQINPLRGRTGFSLQIIVTSLLTAVRVLQAPL